MPWNNSNLEAMASINILSLYSFDSISEELISYIPRGSIVT